MTEKYSQRYIVTQGNRFKEIVYESSPYLSNMEKQQQVENQKDRNQNNVINPTRQNEDQFNDYQTLLLQIEDILDKNLEKHKTQIVLNADQLLNGYPKLQWLLNVVFSKKQSELQRLQIQQQIIELQKKQQFEKQQKEIQQGISKRHGQDATAKMQEKRNLNSTIKQQTQQQEEIIQQKENKISLMEDQIRLLVQNNEDLLQKQETKDKIFQETLQEVKQISAQPVLNLNLQVELSQIRHPDVKLIPILKYEQEIGLETKYISGELDEMLKITQQNSENEKKQQKMEKIRSKFQSVKDQITTVIKSLQNYICRQKQIWGTAKQVDSALNQQVKNNLEVMMFYSKLFENFYQAVLKLLEQSNKYLIESNFVQIERNNENLSNNSSTFIYHIDPKIESQRFYASIKTKSHDTSSMQAEQDESQNFYENQLVTPKQTQRSMRIKKKPCQKQIGQSIFSYKESK